MRTFQNKPMSMTYTLRVLAALLGYPDQALRRHLDDMLNALDQEQALGAERLVELRRFIRLLQSRPGLDSEAVYVELFDRGRGTSLHLFEHVHGDSRDRGPAMIDLVQTYEQAGLLLGENELPDFLPVVLQYASTQPPKQARAFLSEFAHIMQAIFSALVKRGSPYATVLAALLELAGHKAEAVEVPPEPDLEASWEEPPAFGGCSQEGQAAPGQEQPIHFVRPVQTNPARPNGAGATHPGGQS